MYKQINYFDYKYKLILVFKQYTLIAKLASDVDLNPDLNENRSHYPVDDSQ